MPKHIFECIDAHTCGNPIRLVVSGGPKLMNMTKDGFRPEDIINTWSIDVKKFELNRFKYLMYPW